MEWDFNLCEILYDTYEKKFLKTRITFHFSDTFDVIHFRSYSINLIALISMNENFLEAQYLTNFKVQFFYYL